MVLGCVLERALGADVAPRGDFVSIAADQGGVDVVDAICGGETDLVVIPRDEKVST